MNEKKPEYVQGVGWRYATEHRQTRRLTAHDYGAVGTYLITLAINDRKPLLGRVDGDLRARRDDPGFAHLVPSPLGEKILKEELPKISRFYPNVSLWRYVLMPDHLHLILHVDRPFPAGKNLGHVIRAFKGGCSRAYWAVMSENRSADKSADTVATPTDTAAFSQRPADTVATRSELVPFSQRPADTVAAPTDTAALSQRPADTVATLTDTEDRGYEHAVKSERGATVSVDSSADSRPSLFSPGYNDRILMQDDQIRRWRDYLTENPLRLLIRQRRPDIMKRALCLIINGKRYSAYGNFLLLKIPEKRQVMCHRMAPFGALTDDERRRCGYTHSCDPQMKTRLPYETTAAFEKEKTALLAHAALGSPLVTPGISKGEQIIKHECIEARLPLIHLQKEPIVKLWKPERQRFYACAAGKLLILAPWPEELGGESDYDRFHNLNALAAEICALQPDECRVSRV